MLTVNNLREFRPIVHAIRTGNLGLMEDALAKYEFFFVRTGIYLLVEKLKLIVIRQLFKNVQKMAGNHQLQVHSSFYLFRMLHSCRYTVGSLNSKLFLYTIFRQKFTISRLFLLKSKFLKVY